MLRTGFRRLVPAFSLSRVALSASDLPATSVLSPLLLQQQRFQPQQHQFTQCRSLSRYNRPPRINSSRWPAEQETKDDKLDDSDSYSSSSSSSSSSRNFTSSSSFKDRENDDDASDHNSNSSTTSGSSSSSSWRRPSSSSSASSSSSSHGHQRHSIRAKDSKKSTRDYSYYGEGSNSKSNERSFFGKVFYFVIFATGIAAWVLAWYEFVYFRLYPEEAANIMQGEEFADLQVVMFYRTQSIELYNVIQEKNGAAATLLEQLRREPQVSDALGGNFIALPNAVAELQEDETFHTTDTTEEGSVWRPCFILLGRDDTCARLETTFSYHHDIWVPLSATVHMLTRVEGDALLDAHGKLPHGLSYRVRL